MIKIEVHSTHAVVRHQKPLTVGMVGAKVRFSFGEDWTNLVKTAVFRQGEVTVDAVNVAGETVIPWEVLAQPGLPVQIGVYGTNADGTVVIPTLWAETDPVQPGADPSGDVSADPTLPIYQQILAQLGPLDNLDTQAKDTLVVAVNEANRAVYLVTVAQNEDGTYSADKSIEELSAAEDAGKVLLCYLRDVRVLTGLTGGNSGSTYVFTAVIGNTEHRVVMNENGVTCDYSTLATDQSRLANPEKLTFTGAAQAEYDGSTPVEVNIPKLLEVALTASGDTWSADKTYAQILEAYNSGAEVRCRYGSDYVFRLTRLNPGIAEFYGLVDGVGYSIYITAGNTLTATQTPWAKTGDIPTKTSQLENDSGYLTAVPVTSVNGQTGAVELDIPDTLPNPQKLTFEGAVSGEYDGSQAVTVHFPEVMLVKLTESNGTYTADKTHAQILAAHNAGQEVHCVYSAMILPLVRCLSGFCAFACVCGTSLYSVLITAADNSVTMTVTDLSDYATKEYADDATKVFYVTMTDDGSGSFTADKTFAEVKTAHESGLAVQCKYSDFLLPLCSTTDTQHIYGGTAGWLSMALVQNSDDTCTVSVSEVALTSDLTAENVGAIPAPATAAVGQALVVDEVDENNKPVKWSTADAVLINPQELTDEQRSQARENIGAAAAGAGNLMPTLTGAVTKYGVTLTPTDDGVIINGTATSDCYCNLYLNEGSFPDGMIPGRTYCLKHYCDDIYVKLHIRTVDASGTWTYLCDVYCSSQFTIPEDAVGMQIRFYVPPDIPCENMHMKPEIYEIDTLRLALADKKVRRPMLSIIYDDGMADFHTHILPIIQAKKVPIATAVVPGFIENAVSGVMTWEQVEECFLNGAEVLDHTYSHIAPATRETMTAEELEHEYIMGRRKLQHKGFDPPCALVFNGYSANLANCRTAANRVYKAAFNASTGGINYPNPPDPYNINRYSTDNKPLAALTGWIDELVEAGEGWMVWTRHNSNATDEDQTEAAAILSSAIDYALANGVDIVTVERGLYECLGI